MKKLPSYLQNVPLYANTNTHNYATRKKQNVHLEFISNHQYAKICVRYQVPNIVNNTAIYIMGKDHTHSLKGLAGYIKLITLHSYIKKTVTWKIVKLALDHDIKLN